MRALFISICTHHVVDLIGHVALGFDEAIKRLVLDHIRAVRDAEQSEGGRGESRT